MSVEGEIGAQQRALGDLRRARAATSGWSDEQRRRLDTTRLAALESEGDEVLHTLQEVERVKTAVARLLRR